MKTHLKYAIIALAALLVVSLVVCGGMSLPAQAATATITVSGTPWGVSTETIGACEGSDRFDVNDLLDLGITNYRIWGDMAVWEWQDDNGVYGSPSIAEVKADPNVVNWAWYDEAFTNPPCGTHYHYRGCPPAVAPVTSAQMFQALKDNGIMPVVTIRIQGVTLDCPWMEPIPQTAADWNEFWQYTFSVAYWLNVRNDYRVDEYEILNEPDHSGQGWKDFGGTLADYYVLAQYMHDAIKHVYDTYLPGREFHLYAPVTSGGPTWVAECLQNIPDYFDVVDYHAYGVMRNWSSHINNGHSKIDQYGGGQDWPIYISEWSTWDSTDYDKRSFVIDGVIGNMILGSQPDNDYVWGSAIFAMYDWQYNSGLIAGKQASPVKRDGYYGFRLAARALQGGRTTYQTTSSNSKLKTITTQDEAGNIYLLVDNTSKQANTVTADLSALLSDGSGTLWEYSATNRDVIVGTPAVSNGQVTFDVPGTSAVLLKVSGGPPPPTDTPAPPTDTPPPPTDTPIPPTDTPPPPTSTPGGPTDTPAPPTDTPAPTNTPGSGGNLALNKPVEVSSVQSGFPGSNAVDGNTTTYWRTLKIGPQDPRDPEWIKVDLGTSYSVSQVVLVFVNKYASAYEIQVSENGSDWTTVYSTTSGDGGTDVINFGAASARYVRMYATVWPDTREGHWLAEFEVYE
jgi:hypothetical protein